MNRFFGGEVQRFDGDAKKKKFESIFDSFTEMFIWPYQFKAFFPRFVFKGFFCR